MEPDNKNNKFSTLFGEAVKKRKNEKVKINRK